MANVDPELIVEALVTVAEARLDGAAWLLSELQRVTMLLLANKKATSLSFDGSSSAFADEIDTAVLLPIINKAYKQITGAADTSPATGAMLIPRIEFNPAL